MDVELEGVRAVHDGRVVLDVPLLRLRCGRTTAILGPNGSGKTTLLRLVAGLDRPTAGTIHMDGAAAFAASRTGHLQQNGSRPHVAFVFQEPVFLRTSVRENLDLALRIRRIARGERVSRIHEAAGFLGIAHLLDRRADRLSGGEGRRVSLARALCLRAPLVLLDEPLEGLDERTYSRLLDELPQVLAAFEATTLLVTHSRYEALRLADDLVVLVDGRVHAAGDKREVASDPRTREAADVLGYSVLAWNGSTVAVAPGALAAGAGAFEFWMNVETIVDLVEHREVLGRIGDATVRLPLPADGVSARPGERLLVHASRVLPLRS